jgi:hypothetical protein
MAPKTEPNGEPTPIEPLPIPKGQRQGESEKAEEQQVEAAAAD